MDRIDRLTKLCLDEFNVAYNYNNYEVCKYLLSYIDIDEFKVVKYKNFIKWLFLSTIKRKNDYGLIDTIYELNDIINRYL